MTAMNRNGEPNAATIGGTERWPAQRFRFRLIHVLVAMALIGAVLAFFIAPAYQFGMEEGESVGSKNNLHQIALALHNYHDAFGCFPPAYQCDANGKPIHSWRAIIPNFTEARETLWSYDYSEPWNGPRNSELGQEMPQIFRCPWVGKSPMTNYVAVVGEGTMWPGAKSARISDITDKKPNTILLIEISNSNIHWLEPRDLPIEELSDWLNPRHRPRIGTQFKGAAIVAFADGSVRYLPRDVAESHLRALLLPAGKDVSDADENPTENQRR